MGTLVKKRKISRNQLLIIVAVALLVGAYLVYKSFAAAATLYLNPASGNKPLGTDFVVEVRENSGTDPINTVRAHLSFPVDKFQVVSIDRTTSAFPVISANYYSNTSGLIKLEGGTSVDSGVNVPVSGNQLVAIITFRPLTTGSGAINVDSTSAVVRTIDQNGTQVGENILTTRTGATYTIVDSTAPTTPTGLTVGTRAITSIPLSWTASTDNVGVTGYRVYRNGGTTPVGTPTTTSFTDSGLTPNTAYSYTVSAVDAAGNESVKTTAVATSTLPDTVAPTTPTGVTVGAKTMTTIPLTWTASTDNVAVTGYRVYRNGGATPIGTPSTPAFTDSGLAPNTSYSYTISAVDAAGNESVKTTATATSTLPDTAAPSVPTGLKINTQTTTSVTLGWTASTDNVAVTSYRVYRNGSTTPLGTSATNSYTDSNGLALNQTYTYSVSAVDAAGNESAKTATISVQIIKAGDVNKDGQIDIYDLSIMLTNYGKTVAQGGLAAADLNNSGNIDMSDLSILLTNYGT